MPNIVQDTANLRHTASGGNYDDSAASTLTVTVRDNDAPLTFDTSTIPLPSTSTFTFTVGQEVSLMLPGATGGMPPLTYSLMPLPSGLSLDADASPPTITGMSTAVFDPASLTYTVTDSAEPPATDTLTFTVTVNPAPTLEGISDPPTYLVGRTVLLMLPEASDGTAPLTYELTRSGGSPTLSPGLTFNENARPPTLTGTPTAVFGPASLRYTATDKNLQTASQDFMLEVDATVPVTPTGVSAVAGDGQITVSWTALSGADTGGRPIIAYTATARAGTSTASCRINSPATSCTIPSLDNGTAYSVTVVAHNLGGTSGTSPPSTPIMATPAASVLFRIKVFLEGAQ